MVKKRIDVIKITTFLIVFIALIHGASHIIMFKTNLSLIKTVGLSGLAIGEVNTDTIESKIKQNEGIQIPSLIVIIVEWVFIFSLIILSVMKKRLEENVQKETHIELARKKSKLDTEIDILYEMIKKNKRLPLTKLAELFKVDKKIVEEWGRILEESGYVIVDYPRFGEIEIILKEEKPVNE